MSVKGLTVTRLPHRLEPDPARVITRLFCPGDDARVRGIVGRILSISEDMVARLIVHLQREFTKKDDRFVEHVLENYEAIKRHVPEGQEVSDDLKLILGAYFTMEYAIESAALFNPSMVPAHDQNGLPPGSTRFLMSLRAVGEGHISSIVFRQGVVDADCGIHIEPCSQHPRQLKVVENRVFQKKVYRLKLIEMGGFSMLAGEVLERLAEEFTFEELNASIEMATATTDDPAAVQETSENMISLARSNYHLELPGDMDPSEIVIFPSSENESRGIEDVRLVRFQDDDGSVRCYGTYTAYNGFRILPQLLEMVDGQHIKVHTLSGQFAQNKGMALFPRRVNGSLMMVSRVDNESIFLMESDNVRFWNRAERIQSPRFPWEIVQLGNCGSPLETKDGWLLLTHGVGPVRQYSIGATLLDLDDPYTVIGRTREPFLLPTGDERIGYVPNVVYSCGSMIHNDTLIIPYAVSDISTTFATVPMADLLALLKRSGA